MGDRIVNVQYSVPDELSDQDVAIAIEEGDFDYYVRKGFVTLIGLAPK